MDEKKRKTKILVISSVYFLILVLIFWFFYAVFGPEKQTCADGIKNQDEADVDCGGACGPCKKIEAQNLVAQKVEFAESGTQGKIDLLGQVQNPNNNFGSENFKYRFVFNDKAGNVLYTKEGESFILPGEKKYIVENDVIAPGNTSSINLEILSSDWIEFNSFYEKPQIKIINKKYNEPGTGGVFAEAVGVLKNDSPFDFNLIGIRVVLRDKNEKVVAINSTEMRTVKSGEEREFKVLWPNKFSGIMSKIEVQEEINIFSSDSFTERYYETRKFQQSY